MISPKEVSQLIQNRRSVYPRSYISKEITDEIIWEILENARWAPTHKMTQPWRFKVFKGQGLNLLSEFLADTYESFAAPGRFIPEKAKKMSMKPLQSSCVIAVCMQRDPQESLPEWEEIAATASAVQNMWLTCVAYNIGAYWSSPKFFTNHAAEFLKLKDGERSMGLFYMGYTKEKAVAPQRRPIAESTVWFT